MFSFWKGEYYIKKNLLWIQIINIREIHFSDMCRTKNKPLWIHWIHGGNSCPIHADSQCGRKILKPKGQFVWQIKRNLVLFYFWHNVFQNAARKSYLKQEDDNVSVQGLRDSPGDNLSCGCLYKIKYWEEKQLCFCSVSFILGLQTKYLKAQYERFWTVLPTHLLSRRKITTIDQPF